MIYSRVNRNYLPRHLPEMEAEFSKQWNLSYWNIRVMIGIPKIPYLK